jgi:NADPH:quinone reductase-like Zn-dependent oxidoreductase
MAAVFPLRPEGGAQAERIVAPTASVVPIGDDVGMVAAATMPMRGLTALEGLHVLGLEPGATLAVTGGAGLLASYCAHRCCGRQRSQFRSLPGEPAPDQRHSRGRSAQ